jgi:magnesium transporter
MAESIHVIRILEKYFGDDPTTAAHNIEGMPIDEALGLLQHFPKTLAAKLLAGVSLDFASELVLKGDPKLIIPILENSSPETSSSILLILPEDKRVQYLATLPTNLREATELALTFPVDSTGRIMKTDFTAFNLKLSTNEAIAKLKAHAGRRRPPSNVFVVDDVHTLVGVISMRDLVVADGDTKLKDIIITDVLSVSTFDDKTEASRILSSRGFASVPVVDSQKRLVGVIRAANLLGSAQESATQDIQKLFGVGKDERAFSPIALSLSKRLPWLHVNLATAFLAASVVSIFQDTIAKVTILAVYLPVVAGQGGNAGAQSLAVVMRGLVMREIPRQDARRLVIKEAKLGIINGVVIGIVTALIAWAWQGNPFLGLVIGLAMIVTLAIAGLAGAGIPLLMQRFGLDPAQSSSIILTTVTDVIGFFAFLGFAAIFQSYLI